jgi:hypothetical protein
MLVDESKKRREKEREREMRVYSAACLSTYMPAPLALASNREYIR